MLSLPSRLTSTATTSAVVCALFAVALTEVAIHRLRLPLILVAILILIYLLGSFILIHRFMRRQLRHMSETLLLRTTDISKSSNDFAGRMEGFSINANQQSFGVAKISLMLNRVRTMVLHNAENAKASQTFSASSRTVAERGKNSVQELVVALSKVERGNLGIMQQIESSNAEVGKVIDVIKGIEKKTVLINDIVFQSKLLAFNAAVESARASEAGLGFGVVAKEVGVLAKRSADVANEIASLISESVVFVEQILQKNTSSVSEVVNANAEGMTGATVVMKRCSSDLDEIVENVNQVEKRIIEIAELSQNQAEQIVEISSSISQLDEISKKGAGEALNAVEEFEKISIRTSDTRETAADIDTDFNRPLMKPNRHLRGPVDGVSEAEIRIGMSNALSGSAEALGTGMKRGAQAFIQQLNSNGGVHGRALSLVSYDDAYDPIRASANTERLLTKDHVLALFGYVGTATSVAALAMADKYDVPFLAPFTGAQRLRVPIQRNIFHIRASYVDEAEEITRYLVDEKRITRIALFLQDDAYGAAGEIALGRALKKRSLEICGKGIYRRGTTEVDLAARVLESQKPQAILMVGTYRACAVFVRECKRLGLQGVQFFNLSFAGTSAFMHEARESGEGVYISQVTPSPYDPANSVVKEYQMAMRNSGFEDFDYTSLEGYLSARVLAEALLNVKGPLTRESLRESLESLNLDLGGLEVSMNRKKHSASSKVWLTKISNGKVAGVTGA